MSRKPPPGRLVGMAMSTQEVSTALQGLLHGLPPEIVGAALADLSAIWINGNRIIGDAEADARFRREIFEMHCQSIWQLVEFYVRQRGRERHDA